jgi:hypothetical protein
MQLYRILTATHCFRSGRGAIDTEGNASEVLQVASISLLVFSANRVLFPKTAVSAGDRDNGDQGKPYLCAYPSYFHYGTVVTVATAE